MSKSSLSQLTDPKSVAKAAQKTDSREHAMLCGALGAIAKGGKTVSNDESTTQKADHYWRVLNGQEKQKLGEKHFGEISELVKSFIIGPKKVKKVSSMNPSELAKNLRRIASAIENSKNPSKELVLKDLRRIVATMGVHDQGDDPVDNIYILDIPTRVSVPNVGEAVVTITRNDYSGESSLDNVHGTIEVKGQVINVEYENYHSLGGLRITPPEAVPLMDGIEAKSGMPPIEILGLATEKILERNGYRQSDILVVQDGFVVDGIERI